MSFRCYTFSYVLLNTRNFKRMVISHGTLHALFWQHPYWLKKLLPKTGAHHNPLQGPMEVGSNDPKTHPPLTSGLVKKRFAALEGQMYTA